MLVSLPILIALRCIIYRWKRINEHFPTQVQSRESVIEILADEAFTAIDGLISQSFVVTFVHPAHMQIALIWGFPVQLSL